MREGTDGTEKTDEARMCAQESEAERYMIATCSMQTRRVSLQIL
jgi:hypothetical protein